MAGPQPQAITLSAPQQAVLERLLRQHSCPQALALRVRIVLGAATGRRSKEPHRKRWGLEERICARLFPLLIVDIAFDYISGHMITGRTDIVAICPQLTSPMGATELLAKGSKQFAGCQTLDDVHHIRRSIPRRATDKQMDVIRLNTQRFDLPFPSV